jgi:hypothetical protein
VPEGLIYLDCEIEIYLTIAGITLLLQLRSLSTKERHRFSFVDKLDE